MAKTLTNYEKCVREYEKMKKDDKIEVLWGALEEMQHFNGRSRWDCVVLAMGGTYEDCNENDEAMIERNREPEPKKPKAVKKAPKEKKLPNAVVKGNVADLLMRWRAAEKERDDGELDIDELNSLAEELAYALGEVAERLKP